MHQDETLSARWIWRNRYDVANKTQTTRTQNRTNTGTMAIQIASQLANCRVIATAGSDEKCDLCSKLGAHRTVNYNQEDFAQVVQDEYGGVDVVLDVVGGSYISKHFKF